MKKLYLYLLLLASAPAVHAQNIYGGGIADGFAAQNLGAWFYSGGSGSGFVFASYTAPTNPLPLTFLSFTAQVQNSAIALGWQTTNAVNVDHFDIERSVNSSAFQYLTSVTANNNGDTQNYQALDPNPAIGHDDYRLKEVDVNGQFQYSDVVSVTIDASSAATALAVYPNPATQTITISITVPVATTGTITIDNASGQPVAHQNAQLPPGTSRIICPVGRLAAGEYFIRVQGSDTNVQVVEFVKL